MAQYLTRRLMQMVPMMIGITALVFILVRASGDPVALMLPEDATLQQIEDVRKSLGLDRPLYEQYFIYLRNLLMGDFGESLRFRGQAVLPLILERLPATVELALASIAVAILVSLPAGVIAAVYRGRWPDQLSGGLAALGQAMPNFWLGIMLMIVFGVSLKVLPVSGRSGLISLILPAVTLGTGLAAMLMRLLRSSILDVISQDYVRTAKAKGVKPSWVLTKHVLRNALLSYVTILGLQVSTLLAGAVVTEQVFAWPGIGLLAIQSIYARDMAVVQAIVIIASLAVLLGNLLVDMLYAIIDPRIRHS